MPSLLLETLDRGTQRQNALHSQLSAGVLGQPLEHLQLCSQPREATMSPSRPARSQAARCDLSTAGSPHLCGACYVRGGGRRKDKAKSYSCPPPVALGGTKSQGHLCLLVVLGIKASALHTPGKHSTLSWVPSPLRSFLKSKYSQSQEKSKLLPLLKAVPGSWHLEGLRTQSTSGLRYKTLLYTG
jgi:hypothetical protein